MTSETPNEATVFNAARKIESKEDRAAYLDEACQGDAELRQRVDELLQSYSEESQFLEQAAIEEATIIGQAEGDIAVSMEAGLAPVFGEEAAVVIGDASHSVLRSLSNSLNEVPSVSLRASEVEGSDPIARPNSPEMPKSNSDSRYQLQGEIARGGMGAIIKGRDTDLGRDLAIKVLLDSHKDSPEVIQRFVEEAQIGGQLQHPGIAPVYELGQFEDRRPFFSMKLVKGQTLSKLLADREDAGEDRVRFLGIFEQVCQTMAYAHSRGVIHRDLKPANIMVGAFGEVQVMDWGLAKVLSAGGVADEKKAHSLHQDQSIIQTLRSGVGSDAPAAFGSVGSETQIGSIMGTLAYMPPEQALGEIDNLDERADVFGLGSILCEILTGKPCYVADDRTQLFRIASRGKLDDAMSRLDACGADDDLIRLTKQCLELEPVDRPRDAGELAERVTGYLESVETKLRETELQRAAESARATEARKRMRVTIALAASVLLMLGLVGLVERNAVKRRAGVTAKANSALSDAQHHQSLADTGDLDVQLRELGKAIHKAQEAVTLTDQEAVESSLKDRAKQLLVKLEINRDQAISDRHTQETLELIRLSQADSKIQEVSIDETKADLFPSFSNEEAEQSFPLFNISTSLARYDEAFRDAGLDLREVDIFEAAEFIRSSAIRESLIAALDNWARSIPHPAADNKRPSVTREKLLAIADAVDDSEWRRSVRKALETQDPTKLKELAAMDTARSQSPVLIAWLGAALRESNEVESSVHLLEQAQRHDPDDFWLNYELGKSYSRQGNHLEGLGFARTAVGIRPDSLGAMIALARISTNAGRYDEAAAIYQEVISRKPDIVDAHTGLATVYSSEGNWNEAANAYREALEWEPNNVEIRSSLGLALVFAGQAKEGRAECRKAVKLDPQNAMAHFNLAQALDDKSITGVESAAQEYQRVLELDPQHAWAHFRLAQIEAWYLEKNLESAEVHLRTAVELNPQVPDFQAILAHVLTAQGDVDEAVTITTEGIDKAPANAHLYTELAYALRKQKRWGDAVAASRIAVRLNPRDHYAHTSLGAALLAYARAEKHNLEEAISEHLDEAISEHRQAVAINPTSHACMLLGGTLIADKKFAEGALVLAQTYDPNDASLGQTLHIQRQMQTAFKRLFEQGQPDDIYAALKIIMDKHSTSEDALALVVSVRQKYELYADVSAYLEMLQDAPESAVKYVALAEAYHRQGRLKDATRACHKAIELAPSKAAGSSNDDIERSLREQLSSGAVGRLADLLTEQWSVQKWPQLSVQLGRQNELNGIKLVGGIRDGYTEPVIKAEQECRTFDKYAYFTIDEKEKPAASMDAIVGVEYWDDGSGAWGLEYDAIEHPYRRCSKEFGFGGSQTWKTAKFRVRNARFANSQNGHSDFRLYALKVDLHIRRITFQRVQPVLETSDPWARLAAAYHLTGDHDALKKILQDHPHAEVGIGDFHLAE